MEHDLRLEQIRSRVRSLQDELETLQREQNSLYDHHKQLCSASLAASLEDLFGIIFYLRKADRSLLTWHRRGNKLKLVLKTLGYDRRTSANNEKKTAMLKTKVSKVGTSFQKTTETFDKAIIDAEALSGRFTHFSVQEVDSAYHETRKDLSEYEVDKMKTQAELEKQKKRHQTLKSQVEDVANSVQNIAESYGGATRGRTISTAGSILGLSAAAVSAVMFPPSLAITGTLAAGGFLAGGAAIKLNAQIHELEEEQERLKVQLTRQETSLREVEKKLTGLDQTHSGVIQATQAAQHLQLQTRGFRKEAQLAFTQIREVRVVLYTTQSKLVQITYRLSECSYLESRYDIASELRYMLDSMLGIKLVKPSVEKGDVLSKAICTLTEVEDNTVHVLALLSE